MCIYTDEYLSDKNKLAEYQALLTIAFGFGKADKQSKWVTFLENHDIMIAPGNGNVGDTFTEFNRKPVSTVPSDTRTYNMIPGTFFAKGTVLNGKAITKHIVYLNMDYDIHEFTSINYFAHELGHAIDHVLASVESYHSLESKFSAIYDANKDFFDKMKLAANTKDYLRVKNEFFAECFAFYRTKNKALKDTECFARYFDSTMDVVDQNSTPHDYLKKYASTLSDYFKTLAK